MEQKLEKMKELTARLSEAARAYYQESREIISNFEYDKLYDELIALETETGIVLAGSPTQKVGYEILSELPKEPHPAPMLSLDKTKEVSALQEWLGEEEGLLSWKLDGLTVVLTYEGGTLQKAVTRGNGEIGEVITSNAKTFENIPLKIAFTGQLVLRGEAVIRYSDFQKMNEDIEYYGRLSELQKQAGNDFFRTHRAYLVHFRYVVRYDSSRVWLEKGSALMGKKRYQEFVTHYMKYMMRTVHAGESDSD